MTSLIRVYLLAEHEIVRRGVASLLTAAGDIEVVGQAGSAGGALPDILRLRPDVVVLDAHLARAGLDLCRRMRAVDPGIRALVLADGVDEDALSAAILAGASGYVLKQIEGCLLVRGLRLVATGGSFVDPAIAASLARTVEHHQRVRNAIEDLTPQQTKIFHLIAEGLTNRQIAERLFLAEKTVKNHVTGLFTRLGLEHRTQAALLAARLRTGTPLTAGDADPHPAAETA